MNVSQQPMQSTAYLCPVRRVFEDLLFKRFKTIRAGPRVEICKRYDTLTKTIERLLVTDLRSRIDDLPASTSFVLCGDVAKELFRKTGLQRNTFEAPHPSFGHWRSAAHRHEINRMKQHIRARVA